MHEPTEAELRLPAGALVVLVAPSGTGKSTWARRFLGEHRVISSDRLRGVVGRDEHDQSASTDAFELLERIVTARLGRGLSTVVDSTGLEADRRARYRDLAAEADVPCHVVVLDLPEREVRARNAARARPVPAAVVTRQWKAFAVAREAIDGEGFTAVHRVDDLERPARWVGSQLDAAPTAWSDRPGPSLHLHLTRFDFGTVGRKGLATIAQTAEEAGFEGIWLMDHLEQIPQVGRAWDDLPDPWTTIAWLGAHTSRMRLGSLVTPVTLRPLAVLAKVVATADQLSGGRVTCGLGLGWHAGEHERLGVPFPSRDDRYALLRDHLRGLPVLWGPGQHEFVGETTHVAKATSYPRPVDGRVPLLVGGNGPRRTLRLAAEHADAVNVQGDADDVAAAVAALHRHLDGLGRDRDEVRVTVRANGLCRPTRSSLEAAVTELAPMSAAALEWGARAGAGTVEDQVERLRRLRDLGVDDVMVSVADPTAEGIAHWAAVVDRLQA